MSADLRGGLSAATVQPTSLLSLLDGNLEINRSLRSPFIYCSLYCNLHSSVKLRIKATAEIVMSYNS